VHVDARAFATYHYGHYIAMLVFSFRRYGVRSPLGPKQSEATISVHLNRQDYSGGSELSGPYSPISWDSYPRLPNHQWWVRTLSSNCHVLSEEKLGNENENVYIACCQIPDTPMSYPLV
jgi:hypothetical protein